MRKYAAEPEFTRMTRVAERIISCVKGGMPVIWLSKLRGRRVVYNGKSIGRVVQALLCDALSVLEGIWIDRGLRGLRFISSDHICVIGADSVIVDDKGERLRMKPERLCLRAVTTDGIRIGAVTDAAIDPETLMVIELSLVTGWFECFIKGSRSVKDYKCSPGSSRVLVSDGDIESEAEA